MNIRNLQFIYSLTSSTQQHIEKNIVHTDISTAAGSKPSHKQIHMKYHIREERPHNHI